MSENVDQGLEMVQGMIGFKIDEEFLSLLDDTWIIYDTHDSGGLLFTGITASIKVKDGEQFASRIDALIQMAGTQAPRGTPMGDLRIETRTLTHGDHKVTFLNMAGLPIGMAPAWTVDGDQLIVGLYPQMVTSALDRLSETDSGEDSILGHPDVIRARKLIGEPESSWSYVDMKAGIETMYPLSLVLLQMGTSMAQGQGVDIDISAVPSLRTLTRHIFGEVRSTRQVEGGALSIAFGPWPMPANPGVSINAATLSLGTAILLPTLAKAREHSKRTVCGANLRGIGQCLFIYANDHKDQFPDDLTALIKADLCSPEQFVCPGTTAVMPDSPSAEEIEACYIYIPGQFASYGPEDVLVYERPENHDHEGANVLFGDGHVVFIRDMDKLDKMVAKTKAKFAARRKEKSPETDRR